MFALPRSLPDSRVGCRFGVSWNSAGLSRKVRTRRCWQDTLQTIWLAVSRRTHQWEARQAQLTNDVSGAVAQAQQQMAASIAQHARVEASHNQIDVMSGWEQRNKVHDAAMARGDEARRGVTTVEDSTGGSYTMSNEYNYQWKRADGSLMGTVTDTPPDYSNGWELLKKQ